MDDFFNSDQLQQWFSAEKRELPWRVSLSPYAVWVSEVMLQQTQVSVVIPYFERWMNTFPNLQELASSSIEEVIKMWEGLGYYSRARNLHEGAKYLCEHHRGIFPSNAEELAKIKGLGPYTIGAILSFAFHKRAAVVDGNVIRVLTRYYDIGDDISKGVTTKKIWKIAESILPDELHWVHNEALIELGATVCKRKPECSKCPVISSCRGYSNGTCRELPFNSKKIVPTILHRSVAVLAAQDKVLLKQCGPKEIMAGLHEFPYFEMSSPDNLENLSHDYFGQAFKLAIFPKKLLKKVTHSFTRYHANLYPILYEAAQMTDIEGYKWVSRDEMSQLAFSSGHRRIFHQIR